MYVNRAKAIRGLSVANVVISGISIVLVVACCILLQISGFPLFGSAADYSVEDASAYLYLGVFGDLLLLILVFILLPFVAGILGIRNARRPEKLMSVMVWNILGAISYLMGFGIAGAIAAVLCFLVAIFSYQDRKAFKAGFYHAASVDAAASSVDTDPVSGGEPLSAAVEEEADAIEESDGEASLEVGQPFDAGCAAPSEQPIPIAVVEPSRSSVVDPLAQGEPQQASRRFAEDDLPVLFKRPDAGSAAGKGAPPVATNSDSGDSGETDRQRRV